MGYALWCIKWSDSSRSENARLLGQAYSTQKGASGVIATRIAIRFFSSVPEKILLVPDYSSGQTRETAVR